jgi:hypothetical protein
MSEPVGKAGASMHFEQQFGQIHQRHACGNWARTDETP